MNTIASKINDINSFFNTLKNDIGGTLTTRQNEHKLEIDSVIGNGSIRSINLNDGISVLEFDLKVKEDLSIAVESLLGAYVNFVYCLKGKVSHSFGNKGSENIIETFQTSILSNIVTSKNVIKLEKDVHTVATLIMVNTKYKGTSQSQWAESLQEAFISEKSEDFMYIGSYNLKIAETVKELRAIQQEGLVRALLTKGFVNVILALEIEQHYKDIENSDIAAISLTKTEISLIEELMEYIDKHPDSDHKIEKLTRRAGLSAAKIQEGFKFKHNLTVCEYIRYVRLTKAEELISNSDLNISEIVYSLGFTSRSYFSKIFRERFECSPSDYKRNTLAVSA